MKKPKDTGELREGTYIRIDGKIEKCQFLDCGKEINDGDAVTAWVPPRSFKRAGSDEWVHRVLWHTDCYRVLDEQINRRERELVRG